MALCFSGVKVVGSPMEFSGHTPLFLDSLPVNWSPRPSQFLDFWFQLSNFKNMIRAWWENLGRNMSSPFHVATKVRHLKILLKEWHKWHECDLEAAMDRLEAELDTLELNWVAHLLLFLGGAFFG